MVNVKWVCRCLLIGAALSFIVSAAAICTRSNLKSLVAIQPVSRCDASFLAYFSGPALCGCSNVVVKALLRNATMSLGMRR